MSSSSDHEKLYQPYQAQRYGSADPAGQWHGEEAPMDKELSRSIIIMVTGMICCPVWIAGLFYVNSENETARLLGRVSIALFILLALIVFCVLLAGLIW
eukprot:CAMPEP_0114626126 /NCGR_PEP_ID=MMETSP0168-20121206/11619_1 /TAXON_ID=95228 ORGANISM="Vannella sp., Strain DIVA3 517/6/12" /NCGR_SAMPLE_ID=MMETSP0168 /ASSEMBLY_ACC=CAM_ASM_000044 /LENGTH=98 /DNA_ID=CAMNT_0001837417 /DNA_START=137 /DNA_END=430 /DNA_ORIENTATION=-